MLLLRSKHGLKNQVADLFVFFFWRFVQFQTFRSNLTAFFFSHIPISHSVWPSHSTQALWKLFPCNIRSILLWLTHPLNFRSLLHRGHAKCEEAYNLHTLIIHLNSHARCEYFRIISITLPFSRFFFVNYIPSGVFSCVWRTREVLVADICYMIENY